MTEIINIIEDIVVGTVEPTMKRKVGRPRITNIHAQGKEYFRQYYHANNHDIPCECGCAVKRGSMKTHLATKKHFFNMHFKKFAESETAKIVEVVEAEVVEAEVV